MFLHGVGRIFRGETLFKRYTPVHIHELVVHFDIVVMLPNLDRRRRRVHDPSEACGLALEVRIVFLKVISGSRLLSDVGELQFTDLGAKQYPDSIQFGAGRRRVSRHYAGDQQRGYQRSVEEESSTIHCSASRQQVILVPFATLSRNAAKPQSFRTVPSGRVAVLKYPRLGRRLLGLTLIVTLSPTRILSTGTVRRSKAFLSDHST